MNDFLIAICSGGYSMSWYSKVVWSEGLFLRPHHLQQNDRYLEHLLEKRVAARHAVSVGIFRTRNRPDLAQQSKFALRRAAGRHAGRHAVRHARPTVRCRTPIDVPEAAAGQIVWLIDAGRGAQHARGRTTADAESASRYVRGAETFIDSTSALRIEEEIEIAYPRLAFELRKTAKPGYHRPRHRAHPRGARQDHPVRREIRAAGAGLRGPSGDRRLDRPRHRLDRQQARRACALCRRSDLGRRPAERRLSRAAAAQPGHPGAQAFPQLALRPSRAAVRGIAAARRRARDLRDARAAGARISASTITTISRTSSTPVVRDIQDFLSARLGRRAIRLEIIERAQNAFVSPIRDRSLFRNATLVLEVAARRPLIEIQNDFPHLFKVGPNTKMNEIVHAHLPGVPLVHLPTPPPQIRAITDHVYFYLDRKSPLWPEFSTAASIGMHFAGDWPELELELWAILEDRR